MNQFSLGLQVMGYGLIGVFAVLIVSYVTIRVLVAVFPDEAAGKADDSVPSPKDAGQT